MAIMAVRYRLSQAKLASETKNQLIEHIDLRTPSKFQVLTPKTEVASSNGLTGSFCLLLRPEMHIGRWQAVQGQFLAVFRRSFAELPKFDVPAYPLCP